MSRFYVSPDNIKGNRIEITGEEAQHALKVMRLKAGDRIVAFDGGGKEYEAVIKEATKTEAVAEVLSVKSLKGPSGPAITLAQAIPKGAKIDFIIEKATELGVDSVIPMHTARTVIRLDEDKKLTRQKRWEKIAISAAKQCGRLTLPEVQPVSEFNEVISNVRDYDLAVLACLHKDSKGLKETVKDFTEKSILVFIGPEGDFTEEEINSARTKGCRLISLGLRVLRVDTAALNVLSILRYELG